MSSGPSYRLPGPSKHHSPSTEQRGFVLVAVLWLLLVVGVVGAAVLREARSERHLTATSVALVEARLLADAGVNRAILSLVDQNDPLKWQLDGTPRRINLFNRVVEVRIESESGKIDLNAAPLELIAALFRSQGVMPASAESLANLVRDWHLQLEPGMPDQAGDAYRAAARLYGPRHAPFRSVDELRLVLGMTDELQQAVTPLVTVYSHNPTVDRQVATDQVLRALEDAGDPFAESQLNARQNGNAAGANRGPVPGEALAIEAKVSGDRLAIVRTAVVRLTGDARQPYWVLAWH